MVTNVWLILLISHIFSKHHQIHIHDDFLKFEGTKNQWRRHLNPIEPYIGRKNFRRIVAWDRSPYQAFDTAKKSKKNQKRKKKFSARLRFATDVQRRMERSRINFSAIKICTCLGHSSIQCLVISQILECSLDWIMLRLCLQNLPHNLLEVSVWFSIREGQIWCDFKGFFPSNWWFLHTEIVPSN